MLVSCPQCSSRYNLSDDKIRSTGTKVRCPRCQHTFRVFKQEEPDDIDERTELAVRTVTQKQAPTAPKVAKPAASAPETIRMPKDSPFKKTTKSADPLENISQGFEDSPKTNLKRPFKDASVKAKIPPQFEEDFDETPAPSQKDETPTPRPFGDATFLAIQRMGTVKKGKRKTLVAAAVVAVVIAGYFLANRTPDLPKMDTAKVAAPSAEAIKLRRPKEWYTDDPQVFQRFLASMATLPPSEQSLPKNRSLIAEALVLNGMYTGNYDQVAQGVGFASGLIATNPVESYGFYGMTTYSILKDDIRILTDLVNRWPKANREDLEFKIAATFVSAREGQKIESLETIKNLLESAQMAERVQIIAVAVIAESWNEANQVLGEKLLQQILVTYQKKRESLKSMGAPFPDLFTVIDRKIQRKISALNLSVPKESAKPMAKPVEPTAPAIAEAKPTRAPRTAEPPKPQTPPPAVSPQELSILNQQGRPTESDVTKKLNERAAKQLAEAQKAQEATSSVAALDPQVKELKPATPSPTPAVTPPTPVQPKKLPKPSQDLLTAHKQEAKDESDAGKLYKQGLTLLDQKKENDAILAFQKSLRLDSSYAESYKKLGEIYMRKNDKDKALRSFKIYLELKPDSSDKQLVEGWISSLQ